MNTQRGKNKAASIRQKLLNKARDDKRPFNEYLQYYGMERFLFRLAESNQSERLILKGALSLRAWESPQFRPTKDIDFLGKTDNDPVNIEDITRQILSTDVDSDGISFDPETLQTQRITEEADYHGVRVTFKGNLDTAKINFQLDVGFGDVVTPEPILATLPTLLDHPAPRLLCYSKESAIAEKLEAMIKLGELNSRMKDFYDIWLLSRVFSFKSSILAEAIKKTFDNRNTPIPGTLTVLNAEFTEKKGVQWLAFHKRLRQDSVPKNFQLIINHLKSFLEPILGLIGKESNNHIWDPEHLWQKS